MFSGYILAVIGIGILSVVIHLVLPDGKITKNVLAAFSLFSVVVLISPIFSLVKGVDLSNISYELDENFLKANNLELETQLQSVVSSFYAGANVRVQKSGNDVYVFVDLTQLVINEKDEHINYYTAVKELIKEQIQIEDERIVVYG